MIENCNSLVINPSFIPTLGIIKYHKTTIVWLDNCLNGKMHNSQTLPISRQNVIPRISEFWDLKRFHVETKLEFSCDPTIGNYKIELKLGR